MRLRSGLATLLGILLLLWAAGSAFAGNGSGDSATDGSSAPAASSAAAPASGTSAAPSDSDAASAPAAQPDPAPQAGAATETPLAPGVATTGTIGLFTLETGQTLPAKGWSASFFANKFERMPGSVTVLQYGLDAAYGISSWLNIYAEFNPDEHIHVDDSSELSLDTPTYYPEYGTTAYRTLATGGRPGYVQDYPFAAVDGGGVSPVTVGLKFGLLEEDRGSPVSLSIRNDFIIPTAVAFSSVLTNQVQNGQFNDRIVLALSKDWTRNILLTANAGVFLTPAPKASGTVAVQQAQQFLVGGGLIVFPDRRVQIMTEYNSTIFFGSRTPDQSFGPEDPVDGIWGVRLYPLRQVYIDAGYRYMLNLVHADSADRNGFVIKVGTGVIPSKPAPALLPPVVACSVDANSITASSNASVTVSTTASDPQGFPLTYSWTASGGQVEGTGPQVRWVPTGAAPGNYTVTVTVNNDHGGSAMCSVAPTLIAAAPPPPNLPPAVTLSADRDMVFAGEHVHFTAAGSSPENFPLTYTWRANAGQLNGANTMGDLDTSGVNPGPVAVTVRVEDGHGGAADASHTITVQAPPPAPQASKLNTCSFSPAASSRVDNVCKRILDDIALRLQNEPRATVVVIGFAPAGARNAATLSNDRAQHVSDYLVGKGVDRARISLRPGTPLAGEESNRIDIIWAPEGATY